MHTTFSSLLGWAAVASAGSLVHRAVASLDEAATAEAHQRDNGATRAFSNVQIKTSDGRCLVDKLSGDFRANLTPIQVAACGSTDGQGWDIITEGTHISGNSVMLVVSTLTQACLNFDGRRAAGNQVLLFSCGGRADGGGAVTDSQIFEFDGSAGPLTLKPRNQAGSCLGVKGNTLDIAACASGNDAQSFTLGGNGDNTETAAVPEISSTSCTQRIRTVTARGVPSAKTTEPAAFGVKAKGNKTRKTRTSAAATLAVPGNNLGAAAPSNAPEPAPEPTEPSEVVASSTAAEPSEVAAIPEEVESVAVTEAPAASTAAPGAPAAKTTKSGRRTRSAKRFRPKTTKATRTTGAAQPTATVESTAPAANTESEVESSAPASSAASSAAASSEPASSEPASSAASSTAPSSAAASSPATTPAANAGIPTVNPTTPVPVSRAGGTLNPSAAAEAHQRDETATRTFSNVEIRAPNGQCISVDPTAGDFRQNLIPVALVDCSGSPNEKWDVISRGRHNKQGRIPAGIVVSTLTQGCLNFDGRRQAGDTVVLFSCGGRADGSGETSTGQQFPFIGQLSFAFAPLSEGNRTCILDGPDGRLTSGASGHPPPKPRLGARIGRKSTTTTSPHTMAPLCANPPSTARLFIQLSMRRQLPHSAPLLEVLIPRRARAHHIVSPGATMQLSTPQRRLPPPNALSHARARNPSVRTFSTTPRTSATNTFHNPQTDEDGKEMTMEITQRAAKRLSDIMTKDSNPHLALRIQVESGGCHGFQYLMKLVTLPPALPEGQAAEGEAQGEIRSDDTIFTYSPDDGPTATDLTAPKIILDGPSLDLLKGSKVDFTMELIGSQFKIVDNPLATSSCGCGTSFDIKV
ncbi:hypothetical protein B0T14DRAFT_536513 [Immersiella caudata]|uniref:Uncharacterized protein n=1 Tax=Immersiella caudata TaxID=314043 RepID=A0AA40C3G5_9PEZI|nr:hypothetical protein B0T14DRAFT_536513 [Immersiella caudata]